MDLEGGRGSGGNANLEGSGDKGLIDILLIRTLSSKFSQIVRRVGELLFLLVTLRLIIFTGLFLVIFRLFCQALLSDPKAVSSGCPGFARTALAFTRQFKSSDDWVANP